MAAEIGYPVMLKASWGGGGRGMRAIRAEAELAREVVEAKREAKAAFGKDEVYLEKLVERARHVEVQVLGDTHGNAVHLFERDCSIQRRNQKVVERAPAPYLNDAQRAEVAGYALKIAEATDYVGAGTVEFLMDADTGAFYFIEVNPRIQVEHTVTEEVTGIDIVKAQIHILEGKAHRRRRIRRAAAGRYPPQRPRAAVPHHDGRPRAELHSRLWPHHRLSRRDRLRHPPRRRHGLFGRRHHPLLRSASGKGDRLGADAGGGDRPHGPRAARVPHPRRGDQPDLPRSDHRPPEVPRQFLYDASSSTRRRSSSRRSGAATARPSS